MTADDKIPDDKTLTEEEDGAEPATRDSGDGNYDHSAKPELENKQDAPQTSTPAKPIALDPRIFAYREDLADQSLYGRVNAPKYVTSNARQVHRAAIALRKSPDPNAGLETEALFGEHVKVFDEAEGWAWVQLERDSYVGYVPADALVARCEETTHWVRSNGTFVYPRPDIKSPPLLHLSLTSEVAVKDPSAPANETFTELKTGGFVITRHLAKKGNYARDFVEVAERLIETPYLWGGRTRIGIDCSGLVQVSLQAAGIAAPRDTDLQQNYLGSPVDINPDLDRLKRGDLVFWKGHVGIMVDGVMMVHANAHHMSTAVEPLLETAQRIARDSGPIAAIKRLPTLSAQVKKKTNEPSA